MSLIASLLLFLPLAFVISLLSSALRREDWGEIRRHTLRLFATMSLSIVAICAVLHVVMEWVLDG